ncbi:phosphatidylglycerophosphatase A [Granulosicoccaceae sp. 1_MG-2023]|nr:phosphatidylglycerophosphatase A [Granulosicoccaceae sp. 1_MG-2023]
MKGKPLGLRDLFSHPLNFFSLGFGSGLAPKAPGTFGTLAAVPLWWLLQPLPLSVYLLVTLIACVAGIWFCDVTARDLGVHDHSGIVWDEIAGFLITMVAAPAGLGWLIAGFALFRFFDVLKPWPISWFDRQVHGGLGIMLDDIVAGLMALAVMQLAAALI